MKGCSKYANRWLALVLAVSFAAQPSCVFIDAAVDQAAEDTGRAVGHELAMSMQVPMLKAYGMALFAAYFWAGGFWMARSPYEPGEWTLWQHKVVNAKNEQHQPVKVEKAFLARLPDGSEWWRIKAYGEKADDVFVFEAMFSPKRDRIVRMLARFGTGEVNEVQLAEGENSVPSPNTFQEDWINQHVSGTVTVATGKFEFSASRATFTAADGSGQASVYFSDGVPGGIVKYEFVNSQGEQYSVTMIDHGTGARPELVTF